MCRWVKRVFASLLILLFLIGTVQVYVGVVNVDGKVVGDFTYWRQLAENAWQYFQPDVGVNSETGLHYSSMGFHYFTSWDLAVYLNAILDAQELGLISDDGEWGADFRLAKVFDWLQTAQLTPDNQPYLWYDAETGQPGFSVSNEGNNIYDYGSFLVAMHRVATVKPHLADTVDHIVNNRFNTSSLVPQFGHYRDYTYYAAHGFHLFNYSSPEIVTELNLLHSWEKEPKNVIYGLEFPQSLLVCEPLLLATYSLPSTSSLLNDLVYNVYLAHEARYNETGKFAATSEGATGLLTEPYYIYESVISPEGEAWVIYPNTYTFTSIEVTPIVYFKVAVSFLALYDTQYARDMVAYLEPRLLTHDGVFSSACGYMEGIDENGRITDPTTDKTNGLILSAAKYALEHKPPPTPTPTPTPSPVSNFTGLPTSVPAFTPVADDLSTRWWAQTEVLAIVAIAVSFCLILYLTLQNRLKRRRTR